MSGWGQNAIGKESVGWGQWALFLLPSFLNGREKYILPFMSASPLDVYSLYKQGDQRLHFYFGVMRDNICIRIITIRWLEW